MARLYHYAPQREICAGGVAVCQVDLVLRVGGADGSRYPKSRKGWLVSNSLDRSKVLLGDAVLWWWRSRWRKIRSYQDGVELQRPGVSLGPISRRLEWRRLSPEGRKGEGYQPLIRHTRKGGLSSVANCKAKRRRDLPPWTRVRAVFTFDARSLMGSRRSNGKCLFLYINLEIRRSRYELSWAA